MLDLIKDGYDLAFRIGKLIEVLPGWVGAGFPVSMVSPLSVSSSARLKITADQLALEVQKALLD